MVERNLPPAIIRCFRRTALERLDAFEASWRELHGAARSAEVESTARRELHTLKGDAAMVGFAEVSALAQRLEDLLLLAASRKYELTQGVSSVVERSVAAMREHVSAEHASEVSLVRCLRAVEEVIRAAGAARS